MHPNTKANLVNRIKNWRLSFHNSGQEKENEKEIEINQKLDLENKSKRIRKGLLLLNTDTIGNFILLSIDYIPISSPDIYAVNNFLLFVCFHTPFTPNNGWSKNVVAFPTVQIHYRH